ncbi:manganese transport protein [Enhydrobacter aerosaccus]|uniref:Divalent metal cation transporter MntH n=1 Tax=Enhydrobacter aerosaccus TaxID=225324 RepID=A0A1T4QR64_9HYPH|nr:manganese transport protein [Enhydrobacter aerosaccus]
MRGTIVVPLGLPVLQKLLRFAGPGLLVSVGYMDPGNWATDIEAGSRYGYGLLFVVVLTSLAAILLQILSMRLGIAAGRDLAQMVRERYSPAAARFLWLLAELAIIATDVAEVLGSALAIKLLFGLPLWLGILATILDTVVVLGLKGQGFRQIEAIILGLVVTIGICFALELAISRPNGQEIASGLVPSFALLQEPGALYLAVGILGATVMPHNLYLHSSIVQTRLVRPDVAGKRDALRYETIDIVGALLMAALVNAAILIVAASTFHAAGHTGVTDIQDAYRLLEPITGAAIAAPLFGIALLASGQSATFTGTVAGQVVLEGFLNVWIPCWQRRLITRGLALVPALAGILILGDDAVGQLLVVSQVVLSAQLPFAIFPLLRFTADRGIMGRFASPLWLTLGGWIVFGVITAANIWLVARIFT